MLALGKTFEFAAAHRLYRPDWSHERNVATFGKCANPNGHGHNYRLEVAVQGPLDPDTGMIIDAAALDQLVMEHVFVHLDHKNLDLDVPWLKGTMSTVENIAEAIWNRLTPVVSSHRAGLSLYEVKLWETGRIFAVRKGV